MLTDALRTHAGPLQKIPQRGTIATAIPQPGMDMEAPMSRALTYRGELRCLSCGRYLGDFESHPEAHGAGDLHLVPAPAGAARAAAIRTDRGLRCSACNGRVVTEAVERIAA